MQKPFKKLRSSALLIAMVVGVVICATLFGLVAATNQYLKSAGQSRDGKIAYQAALSGVEDGLLRYKYAAVLGKTNLIMRKFDNTTEGKFDQFKMDNLTDAYYNLSIRADSVSIGLAPFVGNWYINSSKALLEKALPLLVDDTMEIDLDYIIKKGGVNPLSIDLGFSIPFAKSGVAYTPISGFFSAVNYQLVNYSARGEEQIVSEGINNDSSRHTLSVTGLEKCQLPTAQCRLRITPRVVVSSSTSDFNTNNRFDGKASPADQKYVFLKIVGKNAGVFIPSLYKPGTLVIESIGVSGDAKRRIQAQIDLSTGRYLGMFDYGVYCGDRCVMP